MAVSKSTIVFALVTCALFGLAVRDMLGDKNGPRGDRDRDDDDDYGRDYEADLARVEAERRATMAAEAEREAEEARAQQTRKTKLRTLYGAEPATLGPALGGVTFGTVAALEETLMRLRALDTDAELETIGETTLHGLAIRLTDTDRGGGSRCSEFEEDLQQVWGDGVIGPRGHYWINPALSQRAALKSLSTVCELRIERYAAPAAWIERGKTAVVPVWAVGRPTKELLDHLGGRGSVEALDRDGTPDQISWTDTGVGPAGRGPTRLTASLDRGRVVAVSANVDLEVDTSDAVVAHMAKVFGAYTEDMTLVWKRARPPLEAEIAGGQLYVTAGKLPE